jgi:hypothetical protein
MEWRDLYTAWNYTLEGLDAKADSLVRFQLAHIEVKNTETFDWNAMVDWWPKDARPERLNRLKEGYGFYWGTKKGTLHTADLLSQSKGNTERQAAILIMAAVHEKMSDLPEAWRGDRYRVLQNMWVTMIHTFTDVEVWHHASRGALPVTIARYGIAAEFMNPDNAEQMICLFAIEACLSLSNWLLIQYAPSRHQTLTN